MNDDKNRLSNYRELSAYYLKSLSGDRMLLYNVMDQYGNILFCASENISAQAIDADLRK
ncbi:MAG: hypothetical protein MUC95_04085 [Spirochaetes bacterium]|nr:hypothetical protein [Spirochaetota bacterium]